jgi:hypothetical protein
VQYSTLCIDRNLGEGNLGEKEYRLSRPRRLDFQGAIHLVHVRGKQQLSIYFDARVLSGAATERWHSVPRLLRFFKLLDECCSECGAQLFGYCMEPNDASLVLRTMGAPLDDCMQRLSGRYSRYLHEKQVLAKGVCPFAGRYESKVLAPEYVPYALRRIHARPVDSGLARRAADYPFSSAAAYMGARTAVRLETAPVWRILESKGKVGLQDYLAFMQRPEPNHVAELFEKGAPSDLRVVGGRLFLARVRDTIAHPPAPVTRDQLLAGVANLLGTDPKTLSATDHQAVLGRALVAWYAQRFGAASLREVGTWFDVSGATLGKGIRHYRRVSPQLFDRQTLPGIQRVDVMLGDEKL